MWVWTVEWGGRVLSFGDETDPQKGIRKSSDSGYVRFALGSETEWRGHSGLCHDQGQGGALDAPRGWGLWR